MAELADALDLGSSGQPPCRFDSCYPHCVLRLFMFVHEKPFCPLNSGVVEHSPILSKFIKFHLFTPFFVQVVVKMVVKKVVVNPY